MNNKGCGWQNKIDHEKPEFYYILGSLIGDGIISLSSCVLGCKSKTFAVSFMRKAKIIGLRAKVKKRYEKGKFKYFYVSLNSRVLFRKIQEVLKFDNFINAEFVSGFLDAEGSVLNYKKGNRTIRRIVIYNTDKGLIFGIKRFLKENNIDSVIYTRKLPKYFFIYGKKIKRNKRYFYHLKISNNKISILNCCSMFNLCVDYKKNNLKKIKLYYMNRLEPVRKCALCGETVKHYAKGYCLVCYKIVFKKRIRAYNKKYYLENPDKWIRKSITDK